MSKKDNEKGKDLSSDEILDSLEKDVAADGQDDARATPEPVVPSEVEELGGRAAEFLAWPVDPDHRSARDVLLGKGARDPVDTGDDDFGHRGSALNFILLILLIGVGVGGVWYFRAISSPDALAAKKAAREAMEQAHLEEQLAKQKKYGVLRVESNPPQAVVIKDGERIVTKNEATGEEIVAKTPINMMDLDISQPVKVRIELENHEPFEFNVAQHLWTKDTATGEYKFFKMVELTPNLCEYWFLYDAKKRRELKFGDKRENYETGKSDCEEHFETASKQGTSVTECTCKIPPEGWEPPKPMEEKDPKKGKK